MIFFSSAFCIYQHNCVFQIDYEQYTIEEKVIERAYKKLALDALVIQQGRLAEQKSELFPLEINLAGFIFKFVRVK